MDKTKTEIARPNARRVIHLSVSEGSIYLWGGGANSSRCVNIERNSLSTNMHTVLLGPRLGNITAHHRAHMIGLSVMTNLVTEWLFD
jgi:hypothetical protein